MKKYILAAIVACSALPVSAHVVITPKEVSNESYQTFSMSVPVERNVATVGMRLIIPEGLESIRPTVKPGWKVEMKKEKRGDTEVITELVWTGGIIPAGFRDEFSFSAKTGQPGTLIWKAYQTYVDKKIVAWDAAPAQGGHNHENVEGPYSQTVIMDAMAHDEHMPVGHNPIHGLILPLLAIAIALVSLSASVKNS
jgi:uncharacterized protein YcnI